MLRELSARTTDDALVALARVQRECPHLHWLGRTRLRQFAECRRTTWTRPTTDQLGARGGRAQDDRAHRDLQAAVIAALERIDARLRAEASATELLWDDLRDGHWEPKSEEVVTNHLRAELERELAGIAIAEREVQVTKLKPGSGMGPRIDLLIETVTDARPLRVYIEVKGNWHPDLVSTVDEQLVGRYLAPAAGPGTGILLVLGFTSTRWKPGPNRARADRLDPVATVAQLRTQAETQISTGANIAVHWMRITVAGP